MNNAELQRRITDIVEHLPPLPEHIDALFDALRLGVQTGSEIVSLIRSDSSLCAEVLHIANSRCYAHEKTIETIDEAVSLIGIEPIIETFGVRYANESLRTDFAGLRYIEQYFEHGNDISRACAILAKTANFSDHQHDMYAVAGLIHDIGRLVIMLATNELSAPLMGTNIAELLSIIHSEQAIVGMNHCDIGNEICINWNFSSVLCEGVLRHHTPVVQKDVSRAGSIIFVAHFISTSDFTGKILGHANPLNEIFEVIGIDAQGFEHAQREFAAARLKIIGECP